MGFCKFGRGPIEDDDYLESVGKILRETSERAHRIGLRRFRHHVRDQLPESNDIQGILEHWVQNRILTRRWELPGCGRCHQTSWVRSIPIDRQPPCPHCGNHISLGKSIKVAYALDRTIRHAMTEGLAPVVLAGRFLRHLTRKGFFWLPGVKYEFGGQKGDIDIFACCDANLVLGECKTLVGVGQDAGVWDRIRPKVLELANLADRCGARAVLLAALVDDFPEQVREVKREIEMKYGGRIGFILLSRQDLDDGKREIQGGSMPRPAMIEDLLPTSAVTVDEFHKPGRRWISIGDCEITWGENRSSIPS